MPLVNHAKQEINAKIVYFGPAAGGKGTNLKNIHGKLKKDCRGKMKSMALDKDRMLFFDFVPPGQNISSGYQVRFHLYTLPGRVSSPSSWKMLLKGVDGIVFVADSDPSRMPDNLQALKQLQELLHSMETVPLIMQYNKRDVENPVPIAEMDHKLNPRQNISVSAVAIRNDGVLDSLSRLIRLVMNKLPDVAPEEETPRPQDLTGDTSSSTSEVPSEAAPPLSSTSTSLKVGEPRVTGKVITIPLTVVVNEMEKNLTVTITLDEG